MKSSSGRNPSPPDGESRDPRPLILLVEDDPTIRDLLESLLTEERPYRVLKARSAADALRITIDECPRLFLFDYRLGVPMSGIELYDELRKRPGWGDIPAIVVSATLPEEQLRARNLCGLSKPFDIEALLAHVDVMLSSSATH